MTQPRSDVEALVAEIDALEPVCSDPKQLEIVRKETWALVARLSERVEQLQADAANCRTPRLEARVEQLEREAILNKLSDRLYDAEEHSIEPSVERIRFCPYCATGFIPNPGDEHMDSCPGCKRAEQLERERDEALHAEDVTEQYRETAEAEVERLREALRDVQTVTTKPLGVPVMMDWYAMAIAHALQFARRALAPPDAAPLKTCPVCERQYPADLDPAIPVCSRVDCPDAAPQEGQ